MFLKPLKSTTSALSQARSTMQVSHKFCFINFITAKAASKKRDMFSKKQFFSSVMLAEWGVFDVRTLFFFKFFLLKFVEFKAQ